MLSKAGVESLGVKFDKGWSIKMAEQAEQRYEALWWYNLDCFCWQSGKPATNAFVTL